MEREGERKTKIMGLVCCKVVSWKAVFHRNDGIFSHTTPLREFSCLPGKPFFKTKIPSIISQISR